jgi:3-hydroxyisobutyrate dehydrogenase-like beta-hydroxyacid dehydrogenase
MKVGFVGLGGMGQRMARRIAEAGHDLAVYNRTKSKTEALAGANVRVVDSLNDLARHASIVLTMLADDVALAAVSKGEGGLLASLPPGGIHVAMGTHGVAAIRELDHLHRGAGQILITAPVIGRPDVAAAGQLAIIGAGPPEAIERCRPLFMVLGRRLFEVGVDPVAASVIKLANNYVLGCAIEAIGEAFALVRKHGVEASLMNQVLTEILFAAAAYKTYGQIILDRTFEPAGHKVVIGLKDVNLMLAAGEAAGVPLPSGSVWRDRLIGAIAHGDGQRDWAMMAVEQARASGLE